MADQKPVLEEYKLESQSDRLSRKTKEAPFMAIGLSGCALGVLYGAYKYKYRGNMTTSMYLMQLRVGAQGTVVAFCTIGVLYSMYNSFFKKPSASES